MLLRRLILTFMLVALAACAIIGAFAVFIRSPRQFEFIIAAAIAIGISMALLLPLTFLVDRPRFRAGGIGLMIVVVLALVSVLGLCISETIRGPHRRAIEDMSIIILGFNSFVALPAAGALLLDSFAWARISVRVFAVAAVVSLCLGAFAALTNRMHPFHLSEQFAIGAGFTAILGLLAALLLINVGQGDRRYFRIPALGLVGVTAIVGLFYIVSLYRLDREWNYFLAFLLVLSCFFAHLNLLLMARIPPAFAWVRWLTSAAAAACGSFILIVVRYGEGHTIIGLVLASAIAALCGSLALIVLTLLGRRFDYRSDATPSGLLREIQLTCPRCSKAQVLPLGNSACSQCGLKFSIQATEHQCLQCGYLLYGLTTPRCPECGAVTSSTEAPAPVPV